MRQKNISYHYIDYETVVLLNIFVESVIYIYFYGFFDQKKVKHSSLMNRTINFFKKIFLALNVWTGVYEELFSKTL